MDSAELSRKVAEAMGWTPCPEAHTPGYHGMLNPETGGCEEFDLADARDREAVIEWLRAAGFAVMVIYNAGDQPDGVDVTLHRNPFGPFFPHIAPTIAEALGRAFLAATEGE